MSEGLLAELLKRSGGHRISDWVAVCGIGNRYRRDDGAGPSVIDRLKGPANPLPPNVAILDGGETPENLLDVLRDRKFTWIIFVDAGDLGAEPGATAVFEPEETSAITFSTHRIPVAVISSLIKAWNPGVTVSVILVQPGDLGYGDGLTPEVEEAVNCVCGALRELLRTGSLPL